MCDKINTTTSTSNYEDTLKNELYDIIGPLAFINGACAKDANIRALSKEDGIKQDIARSNKRKRLDNTTYDTEWQQCHNSKAISETKECTTFYGPNYPIQCEECTDAPPPPSPKKRKTMPKTRKLPSRKRPRPPEEDNRNVPPDKRPKRQVP